MRHLCVSLFLTAIPSLGFATADQDIHDFLKERVIGKTLIENGQGTLSAGTIGYTFHRKLTYSDLAKTERGLTYTTTWIIEQTKWDIGENGEKSNTKDVDRAGTSTCELRRSASVGAEGIVHGICRVTSNTFTSSKGAGNYFVFKMDGDALTYESKTIGFGDCWGSGDTREACISYSSGKIYAEEGKLVDAAETKSYAVDLETGEPGELRSEFSNINKQQ